MKSAEVKVRFEPLMMDWITKRVSNSSSRSQFIRDLVAQAMRTDIPGAGELYVHQTRGSVVSVLGEFEMQGSHPVTEGQLCVAYVHEGDRTQWVRPKIEFYDGRFKKVG